MSEKVYSTSNFYRKITLLCNNETNRKQIFNAELKKKNFDTNKVIYFLNNYNMIEYTADNLNNYIMLINYFEYDVKNKFISHILSMWEYICDSEIVKNYNKSMFGSELSYTFKKIIKKCSDTIFINCNNDKKQDKELENYKLLLNLDINTRTVVFKNIRLNDNLLRHIQTPILNIRKRFNTISNKRLKYFKCTHLNISINDEITNDCIKHMDINILILAFNTRITDMGIKNMNLHTLNISYNYNITNDGIRHMNLHTLNISNNCIITDDGLKHMNLHTLKIRNNNNITNDGIKHMNLHTLDISDNLIITDDGIKYMNLRFLYMVNNKKITDGGIKHMDLSLLDASNSNITNEGIKHMNLHSLIAYNNKNITYDGIKHMKLKNLVININGSITESEINLLGMYIYQRFNNNIIKCIPQHRK
jgi:hypothetical protein